MKKLNTEYRPMHVALKLACYRNWISLDDKNLMNECGWCKLVTYETGKTEIFALTQGKEVLIGVLE